MGRGRRFKIVSSIIFVFLITAFSVMFLFVKEKEVSLDSDSDVMGVSSNTGIPYITSLPPISGQVGYLYLYSVDVVDSDTEDKGVFVEYVEGPSWLNLEGKVLSGIPALDDVGTFKFVLRVSDGYNTSVQESYILVEENAE